MDPIIQRALEDLGILTGRETRADAEMYTMNVGQALEYVKRKTYDVRYPELKGRQLVPPSDDQADTGAETISYEMFDEFGMAQIIANYADDLPMVDALMSKYEVPVVSIGNGWMYSIQDIRRSAMSRRPLTTKKAMASRRTFETKIDTMIAIGDSRIGIYGLANNPNVSKYAPITGNWTNSTPAANMLNDMIHLVKSTIVACGEMFEPNRLLMPLDKFQMAASKNLSTTGDSTRTVLAAFREIYPNIQVISWNRLATAGTGNTTRMVCYPYSSDVMTFEEPQPYEVFPPQAKNLAFIVPAHGRTAAVIMYYPLAVGYMDGV